MGSAELGQPFSFQFEGKCMYSDPEFRSLFILVKADITVSHPDRDGDERAIKIVESIVNMEITNQIRVIEEKRVSYSDLQAYIPDITNACCLKLNENGFNVISFNITSMDLPDDIKVSVERMKMMKSMTPEEIGRKAQEAQQAAMQAAAQMGTVIPAQMGTAIPAQMDAPAPGAVPQGIVPAMDPPPAQPYPKFCPNCGTATTGSNFCGNCGQKLKY